MFLATGWLIVSWALTVGFDRPIQPSSSTFEPGVKLMLSSLMAGLMLAWPLGRLSQPATRFPGRLVLFDLFVLVSMVQVVIWPLRLVTRWTVDRTLAIDAVLVGWLLLAGALVASAIGTSRRGPRLLIMVALVVASVLGPALWVLQPTPLGAAPSTWRSVAELSPFMFTHRLGDGGGAPLTMQDWRWVLLLLATAATAWGVVLAANARRPGSLGSPLDPARADDRRASPTSPAPPSPTGDPAPRTAAAAPTERPADPLR